MSGKYKSRGTFVLVKHGNQKRNDLSRLTKRTLGSGNLKEAVKLPKGENIHEWIATHCVDFYNEICALYEIAHEDADKITQAGEGFPPNTEYRWADPSGRSSKPTRCSSPEYVENCLQWIESKIADESVFVVDDKSSFPDEFDSIASRIFTFIFRIYAIIYNTHFDVYEASDSAPHLNSSFKHFIFFTHEHGMLDSKEYNALNEPVKRLLEQYNTA